MSETGGLMGTVGHRLTRQELTRWRHSPLTGLTDPPLVFGPNKTPKAQKASAGDCSMSM